MTEAGMSRAAYALRAVLGASALVFAWLFLSLLLAASPAYASDSAPETDGPALVAVPKHDATGELLDVAVPLQSVPAVVDRVAGSVVTPVAESVAAPVVESVADVGTAAVEALPDPAATIVKDVTSVVPEPAPVTSVVPDLLPELPRVVSVPSRALPVEDPVEPSTDPETVSLAAAVPPTVQTDAAPLAASEPAPTASVFQVRQPTAEALALPAAPSTPAPSAPPADRPQPATPPTTGGDSQSAPLAVMDGRASASLVAAGISAYDAEHVPSLMEEDHPATPD